MVKIKIEVIPTNYLINIPRKQEFFDKIESDFMLKGIRIKNTFDKPVRVTKYAFDLKAKGKSQRIILYSEESIQGKIAELMKFAKRFLKEREGIGEIFRTGNLQKLLGTKDFCKRAHLSTTTTLEADQETGLLSEHFRIAANDIIDELVITAYYIKENEESKVQISIPVIEYKTKNQYIFPVKGSWYSIGNWDDVVSGHRGTWSQEFAFDLAQLDNTLQILEKQKRPNEEFPCYGKEVIAIADGEVMESVNTFPDNPASDTDMTDEQITEHTKKEGFVAVGAGNYVILKHKNDEYSFYAHLIPSSLKVKKGDKVKQGQVLGKVGNSGYSTGPHLHFQLMDRPSHLTGRGLPCQFINIKNCYGLSIKSVDQANSIIHTFDL
ncbi:MAG: M23 family metallopeptidase [Promethearchaeota archaeon]